MLASDNRQIQFAAQARDPFQFLSKILSLDDCTPYQKIPLSKDASASAYQIMSYLLLNHEMARRERERLECTKGSARKVA